MHVEGRFGPVKPNSSRNASSSVIRGSTASACIEPFTVILTCIRTFLVSLNLRNLPSLRVAESWLPVQLLSSYSPTRKSWPPGDHNRYTRGLTYERACSFFAVIFKAVAEMPSTASPYPTCSNRAFLNGPTNIILICRRVNSGIFSKFVANS